MMTFQRLRNASKKENVQSLTKKKYKSQRNRSKTSHFQIHLNLTKQMKTKMGHLGFYLCALFLIAATNASLLQPRWYEDFDEHSMKKFVCQNVQNFEKGHQYVYNYEATIVSSNNEAHGLMNRKRISCEEVKIRVPRGCMGVLSIQNCSVKELKHFPNGTVSYVDSSVSIENLLGTHMLLFFFNQGKILSLYHSSGENVESLNFKRGILSALQLDFARGLDIKHQGDKVKINEVNIFGRGQSEVQVQSVKNKRVRNLQLTRNLSNYELPWSRHQWSTLRSVLDGTNIGDFMSDLFVEQSKSITGNASQSCNCTLFRGRRITDLNCIERKPVNLFNNTLFKLLLGEQGQKNLSSSTIIGLKMKQTSTKWMNVLETLNEMELFKMKNEFIQESLMFQDEWNEIFDIAHQNFDPVAAMMALISTPNNRTAPALFSKLGRYICNAPLVKIDLIWDQIEKETKNDEHLKVKATNIWVSILLGCTTTNYWCSFPECKRNSGCQCALNSFIRPSRFTSLPKTVQKGVIQAFSSMTKPNIAIVSSALDICRVSTTPETVLMLGRTLKHFIQYEQSNKNHYIYLKAKQFLEMQFQDCYVQEPAYNKKSVKITAIKSIGALGEQAIEARHSLLQCATCKHAPKEVVLNAIRALQEMPATEQIRSRMLKNLQNQSMLHTLRLASYLLLITKEPSLSQIRVIVRVASQKNQSQFLKYYVTNHIKSQLQLRNTQYCDFSPSTIQHLVTVLKERTSANIDIDVDETLIERRYHMSPKIAIPLINKPLDVNISSSLIYTKQSLVPILVKVNVTTLFKGSNITLLETTLDFSKIIAVIEPLIGSNGVLPKDGVKSFLNLPLASLIRPLMRDSPLLSLSELEKLAMIQDEGSLAFATLLMKNKTPFDLKLFGIPINSETLLKIPTLKSLKLKNIWKIVDSLEKGWDLTGILANQPLLAHIAAPTSMGSPQIVHIEGSYFAQLRTNITAPVKQLLLARRGTVVVKGDNSIKANFIWMQKVQLPKGLSCGTGYQASVGHKSKLGGSVVLQHNSMAVSMEPLLPETEIVSLQLNEMKIDNGQMEFRNQEVQNQQCPSTCIWPLSNCNQNALYCKTCLKPLNMGLYLRNINPQASRYVIQVDTTPSSPNQPAGVSQINMAIHRGTSKREKVSMQASFNRDNNKVKLDISKNGQPWKKIEAGSLISFKRSPDSIKLLEHCYISLNVTSQPANSVAVNKLFITKKRQEKQDILEYFTFSETNEDKVKYSIESAVDIMGQVQFNGLGDLSINKHQGGYDARVHMKTGTTANGQHVGLVKIDSIQVQQSEMSGLKTKISIENIKAQRVLGISSIFSSIFNPITEIQVFSRYLNNSKSLVKQEMYGKVFTNPSVDPYFLYSASQYKKINGNRGFLLKTTQTVNKAQIQMDVFSPKPARAKILQYLIIPSKSLPESIMSKDNHHRIEKNNPQLKPITYITMMDVGSDISGKSHFLVQLNEQKYIEQSSSVQDKNIVKILYVVDNKGFKIVVEINGMKFHTEYAKEPNSQGNFLLFDMNPAFLKHMPISDKAKKALHYHSYSQISDSLKIGYIFKTNISRHILYYEVGYFIGDKKFVFVSNISTNGQPFDLTNAVIRTNVTCEDCLPLSSTSFKSGFAIVSRDVNQPQRQQQQQTIVNNKYFDLFIDLQIRDGIEAGIGFQYNVTNDKEMLLNLSSSANVTFSANRSNLRHYLSQDCYSYYTAMNATLLQRGNNAGNPKIYNISYPIGFYKNSPLMVGTYKESTLSPQEKMLVRDICPPTSTCKKSTIELTQVEKCKDYTPFYSNQKSKSVNCTEQTMSFIRSSYGTYNLSVKHDGRRNPDLMLKLMSFDSLYDVTQVMRNNLSIEISSSLSAGPILLGANMTLFEDGSDYAVTLKSEEVQGNMRKEKNSNTFHADVTTQHIPLKMICTIDSFIDKPIEPTLFYMTRCRLSDPYLTGSKMVQVIVTGHYKNLFNTSISAVVTNSTSNEQIVQFTLISKGIGEIKSELYCGKKNSEISPCHIMLYTRSNNVITYNARVNSTTLNHTANANLTGYLNGYISDLRFDLETTSSLKLYPSMNSSALPVSSEPSQYELSAIVKDNKVNLARLQGNWSCPSMVQQPSSISLHYISNKEVDLDIYFGSSVGKEMKVESRIYQGLNRRNSETHLETSIRNTYLEMYFLQYTQCLKNMTVSVKNLYDRKEVEERTLIKMESKVKSNVWPVHCSSEWQKIFSQLFPIAPITPICSGDTEVDVSYDLLNNSQVQVNIYHQSEPLLKAVYQHLNNVHNLTAICSHEKSPTCRVLFAMGSRYITVNSTVTTELLRHRANISLTVEKPILFGQQPQVNLDVVSNNTINHHSDPIDLNSVVKYSDQDSWYVYSRMNASNLQDNVVFIENGTIKKIQLQGKSVLLFSKPRDWNITYTQKGSAYQLNGDIKFDVQSRLIAAYYDGQNQPQSYIYESKVPKNVYIEGFVWNYTNCDEHVVTKWITVRRQKEGKHLLTKSMADINMWPFKSTSYINLPVISSCYYCLGDLQFVGIYNSTTDNQLLVKVSLDQVSLLQANYKAGQKPKTSEYYLLGAIELLQNTRRPSSPHMLLGTNITITSSQLSSVSVTLLREGYGSYNYMMKQNLTFASSRNMKYVAVVNSESLSLLLDLQRENQTTKLSIKYPYNSKKMVLIVLRNRELEINNIIWKVASSECRLNKIVLALVKEQGSGNLQGISMGQLDFHVVSNLHYEQPEVVRISGSARLVAKQDSFIDVYDTERRKFVISANVSDPSAPHVISQSFVLIRLPFMKMDLNGATISFPYRLENYYNCTIEWLHCVSNQLVPVFKLKIKDSMLKSRECVYHGKLAWEMNAWAPSYSSFHLNPVLNVAINPIKRPFIGEDNNMTVVFKMGKNKVKSETYFSNEMKGQITLLSLFTKNLTLCVPRTAHVGAQVKTPMLESIHSADIRRGNYKLRSDVNVSVSLPLNVMKAKIMNITSVMDFKISPNHLLVGEIYSNGNFFLPWTVPYNSIFTVTEVLQSPQSVARKIDFIQHVGNNQPITFNLSAPSSENKRSVVLKAVGEEIATATVTSSSCALPLPILPETLCVPENLQITNITVDIPVVGLVQELDILRRFVPYTRLFDIRLRNSFISIVTLKQGKYWNVTTTVKLISPVVTKAIADEMPIVLGVPLQRLESMKFDVVNMFFSVAKTPQGIETALKTAMLSPLINDGVHLHLVNLLRIQKLDVQVETKSILKKLLPLNIDCEFNNDLVNNKWTFEVHSFHFKLLEFVNGNIGFRVHSDSMHKSSVKWSLHSKKYPFVNHIAEVKIEKNETQPMTVHTNWSNSFFSVGSSHGDRLFYKCKMNFNMPTGDQVVNMSFFQPYNSTNYLRVVVVSNTTRYVCNTTRPKSDIYNFNCSTETIITNESVEKNSQQVKLHSINVPTSPYSALHIVKNILYAHATKQSQFEGILSNLFGIMDKLLQKEIYRYWTNISSHIKEIISGMSLFSPVKEWQDYVHKLTDAIPLLLPTSEFAKKALIELKPMLGVESTRVVSGSNFLALQYNITSKPRDIMLQFNFTSIQGLPIVNVSLITPQSEMFIKFNIGSMNIYKLMKVGVKSFKTPNYMKMNFTSTQAGQQCVSIELTSTKNNKYICFAKKAIQEPPQWKVVCYKLEKDQPKREVSRFTITSPSYWKSLETLYSLSMHYVKDDLESYLDNIMNIQPNTPFSTDITRTVYESYETLRQILFSVCPKKTLHLHQLERLSKEAITLGLHEIKKLYEEEGSGITAMKLMKSGVGYLTEASSRRGVKIPLMKFTLFSLSSDLYIELGKPDKKIALVLDTILPSKSRLSQEMRADLYYVGKSPLIRYSVNNTFLKAFMDMSLSNMTMVRASIGLPETDKYVKVSYVGNPGDPRKHYQVEFEDTEGSQYKCDMQETSRKMMIVRCEVERNILRSKALVCQFKMPVSSMNVMSLLTEGVMLIPEMYVAANKPEMFKQYIKKTFHITDERSLTVISVFLSKISKHNVDLLHNEFVQFHADKIIHIPVAFSKNWNHCVTSTVMTVKRFMQTSREKRTLSQALLDSFQDIIAILVSKAGKTVITVQETCQNIDMIAQQLSKSFIPSFIPMVNPNQVYNITEFVSDVSELSQIYNEVNFIAQLALYNPYLLKDAVPKVCENVRLCQYVVELLKIKGPSAEWITLKEEYESHTQQIIQHPRNKVITFSDKLVFLLDDPLNSTCKYVYVTEPLENQFNIISKGKSLLLTFPDEVIEMTVEKRVFITRKNSPRREITLPFTSKQVFCHGLMDGRHHAVECKSMEYSVLLRSSRHDSRVQRFVTIYDPMFAIGVMGVQTDLPTSVEMFLPTGNETFSPGKLLNSYLLSGNERCHVSEQPLQVFSGFQTSCKKICHRLFNLPQILNVKTQSEFLYNEYYQRCEANCHFNNKTQACVEVRNLIRAAKFQKMKVQEVQECLPCHNQQLVSIDKSDVYVLVSLSSNYLSNPNESIVKLIRKLLTRMRENNLSKSAVGIITYGGQGEFYKPQIVLIEGLSVTSNIEKLNEYVRSLNFNGPSYDPKTTKLAIELIAMFMRYAPDGLIKSVLVVAPEDQTQNLGQLNMTNATTMLKDDYSSLFMLSKMNQEQCRNVNQQVVEQTGGACVNLNQGPSGQNELVYTLVNKIISDMGKKMSCHCKDTNGEMQSKCNVVKI